MTRDGFRNSDFRFRILESKANLHIRNRSIKLRDIIPYKREGYVIYLLTMEVLLTGRFY